MISKSRIQFIKSLTINKYRKIHNQFIAEGPKIVHELSISSFEVEEIYALPEWIKKNRFQFSSNTKIHEVSVKELERISALKSPNQVLAVVQMIENKPPDISILDNLVLMLDDISDPGNMGTIVRTADWFGIQQIICSETCVDIYNPKVVQATMGSLFRVQVFYTDLVKYIESLPRKFPIYGTMLEGENIHKLKLQNHGILLIGNESRGISENLVPFFTHKITIPNYSNKAGESAESLNASTAAAIICAEFRRQSG